MFNKIKLFLLVPLFLPSLAFSDNIYLEKDSIMCTTVGNLGSMYTAAEEESLELMQWMFEGKWCVVNKEKIEAVSVLKVGSDVRKIHVFTDVDGQNIPLDFWTFSDYIEPRE